MKWDGRNTAPSTIEGHWSVDPLLQSFWGRYRGFLNRSLVYGGAVLIGATLGVVGAIVLVGR